MNVVRLVNVVTLAIIAATLVATGVPASAQSGYPNRNIRMLFGFAAGTDVVARILADKLSDVLEKPVIVENITGAGGTIAADRLAKAVPDGYTIGILSNGSTVVARSLYKKLQFDPMTDLVPVVLVYSTPNVLVVPENAPVKTVDDLIAIARSSPGKLSYGSAGTGSSLHLAGELFKHMAKIDIQHVPYRGSAPVATDLLGGQITMSFIPPTTTLAIIREKKLRPLAVTSLTRTPFLPDVPTMDELGYNGFDIGAWFGMFVPVGTPEAIIERLNRETVRIMSDPDIRAKLEAVGTVAQAGSQAEFKDRIKREATYWEKTIKDIGLAQID